MINWNKVKDRETILRHPRGGDFRVLAQTDTKVWLCLPDNENDTQELWKECMTEWTRKNA